jgi:hypothetical protein
LKWPAFVNAMSFLRGARSVELKVALWPAGPSSPSPLFVLLGRAGEQPNLHPVPHIQGIPLQDERSRDQIGEDVLYPTG